MRSLIAASIRRGLKKSGRPSSPLNLITVYLTLIRFNDGIGVENTREPLDLRHPSLPTCLKSRMAAQQERRRVSPRRLAGLSIVPRGRDFVGGPPWRILIYPGLGRGLKFLSLPQADLVSTSCLAAGTAALQRAGSYDKPAIQDHLTGIDGQAQGHPGDNI